MTKTTTHGTFEEVIQSFEADVKEISRALKILIASLHPEFLEVAWPRQKIASYGVGSKKMFEHYAYIAPQKRYVNLGFYQGASLQDLHGLLEGTGKKLRHIKIHSVSEASQPEIAGLLRSAIQERKRATQRT